jgi:hypothetical protein
VARTPRVRVQDIAERTAGSRSWMTPLGRDLPSDACWGGVSKGTGSRPSYAVLQSAAVGHAPTLIPPPVIGCFAPQGGPRRFSVEAHDSIAWLAARVPRLRVNITQFYCVFAPSYG